MVEQIKFNKNLRDKNFSEVRKFLGFQVQTLNNFKASKFFRVKKCAKIQKLSKIENVLELKKKFS